jgi:hypothetical protein
LRALAAAIIPELETNFFMSPASNCYILEISFFCNTAMNCNISETQLISATPLATFPGDDFCNIPEMISFSNTIKLQDHSRDDFILLQYQIATIL